jgi:group I intron endonuclease
MKSAFIYKITCTKTNKSYIGQTIHTVKERWLHHLRMTKYNSDLHPITREIKKFGKDSFEIFEIECCDYKDRFKRENHWIDHYNTLIPNGYNAIKNTEYRDQKELLENYLDEATNIKIVPIKNNDEFNRIYVLFEMDLLKFGLSEKSEILWLRYDYKKDLDQTFEELKTKVVTEISSKYSQIPIKISSKFTVEDDFSQYRDKLELVKKIKIDKIRISTMKNNSFTLCAVYISDKDKRGYKNQKRVCFGGRKIPINEAIKSARNFCKEIQKLCDYNISIVEDKKIQCQQQEATT